MLLLVLVLVLVLVRGRCLLRCSLRVVRRLADRTMQVHHLVKKPRQAAAGGESGRREASAR